MNAVQGKKILITGASGGIGEAIARRCGEEGAQVAVLGRRAGEVDRVALACGGYPIVADVTSVESTQFGVAQAVSAMGGLDVLINNAGIGVYGHFRNSNAEDWRRMVEVNLLGSVNATRECIPHLLRSRHSEVIMVGSATMHRPPTDVNGLYVGTKLAIRAFADGLRQEFSQNNIRVTTVSPGAVDGTKITEQVPDRAIRNELALKIAREGIQPKDVANGIVLILSTPPHINYGEVVLSTANPLNLERQAE